MNCEKLMEEFGLEVDDVRWFLSAGIAGRIRTLPENELACYIWSGKLEAELYDMADRFLNDLTGKLKNARMSEAEVRAVFREIEKIRDTRQNYL